MNAAGGCASGAGAQDSTGWSPRCVVIRVVAGQGGVRVRAGQCWQGASAGIGDGRSLTPRACEIVSRLARAGGARTGWSSADSSAADGKVRRGGRKITNGRMASWVDAKR
jgi:hypothetical protein